MIRTEELDAPAQLEALRPEWSALWDACPTATPFQSPEWLIAWWDVFHPGRLAAVTVRQDGRLIGLAPFYIAGDRVLRFIGTSITDYLDILTEPASAAAATGAIWSHLDRTASAWDCCDLLELRQNSPLLAVPAPAGLSRRAAECSVCPVAPLPPSPGGGLRRNLGRYGQRLNALGETSYETESGARHGEYLDALFRLHAARWRERRSPGVLANERVREFHRRAAAAFAARGWLRLYGLRHNGSLAVVIYAFAAKRRVYFYLSGHTPELSSLSPGVLLLSFALNDSARAGFAEADFLRGNEPYKYFWGARDRPNFRLILRATDS